MNPRQFSESSFNSADALAKDAAVRLFSYHPRYRAVWAEDYYRNDPGVRYMADMVIVDRDSCDHVYSLEVEVKSTWRSGVDFPYRDIQFVPRKMEKWGDPSFTYGRPTHWMLFNEDASKHLVVFDDTIRCLSEKRWVRCQVRGMEELYCIDKSLAYIDHLEKTH